MFVYFGYDVDYLLPTKKAIENAGGVYLGIGTIDETCIKQFAPENRLERIFFPFVKREKRMAIFEFYKNKIPKANEYIFVFTMAWADFILNGYIEYLRKCFHEIPVKICLHLLDISAHYKKSLKVDHFKKIFDQIITFDLEDARRYGFHNYKNGVYEALTSDQIESEERNDVFFVGQAKNRLEKIHDCYRSFIENGLACDFWITGVKEEDMKYKDRIHYNQNLTYHDVIKKIRASRCILEIMQRGGTGYTYRTYEAICYRKKLISDNSYLKQAEFYNDEDFIIINDIPDIEKIKRSMYKDVVENIDAIRNMKGKHFVEYIQSL